MRRSVETTRSGKTTPRTSASAGAVRSRKSGEAASKGRSTTGFTSSTATSALARVRNQRTPPARATPATITGMGTAGFFVGWRMGAAGLAGPPAQGLAGVAGQPLPARKVGAGAAAFPAGDHGGGRGPPGETPLGGGHPGGARDAPADALDLVRGELLLRLQAIREGGAAKDL